MARTLDLSTLKGSWDGFSWIHVIAKRSFFEYQIPENLTYLVKPPRRPRRLGLPMQNLQHPSDPFGIAGSPSTFQNLTNSVLTDLKWKPAINYLE